MAFTEALRMLITADTGQAVTSIKTLGSTTDRELGKSTKTIDKWSRGFTVAGAGMVAFGAAALAGLGMAAKSASDLGEAVNASQVVFGRASGTIDKFAQNSATSMGLSQRAFRQALVPIGAMLQNFGMSQEDAADQSVKLAQRAADMASVFNTDVNDALAAIQAGLRGEMDPLERFGVGLNEAAVNAKAMELGLATSTGEVDAAAKAQARLALVFEQTDKFAGDFANTSGSLANRQRILSAQFEDLKAAIGEGALPVFETFVDVASKGIGAFQGINDATGGMAGKIATIGSVGLIAAGGLSVLIGQLLRMREQFSLARSAVADFAGSGGLGRLARVSLVIGGFIALREVLMALDNDLEGIDVTTLENQLLDLSETGKIAGDQLAAVFENFGEAIESGDPQKLEAVSNQLGKVDEALAQLASRDPEAAAASFRAISDRLRDMGASSDQVKQFFDDYAAATTQADTASRTAASGVDELGGAMGEQADETTAAQDALQSYLDSLSAMFDPLFGATDALMDNQQAQANVTKAAIELAAAQKEHGKSSLEAMAAQQNLTAAQLAAGKSALNVKQATAELSAAVKDGTVSVKDAKAMLATWVTQGLISQSTAGALARQFDGTANAAKRLGDTDPRVDITARDNASGTIRVIQQKIDRLTGKTVTVSVVASYTASASNALQTFGGRQAGGGVVPRYMQSGGVNWNMGAGPRGSDRIPAWLTPGELILNMGQQGKLFRAIESGQIGGRGAAVVNINVGPGAIVANDPKAVAEGLIRYVRRDGAGQLQRALGIR